MRAVFLIALLFELSLIWVVLVVIREEGGREYFLSMLLGRVDDSFDRVESALIQVIFAIVVVIVGMTAGGVLGL